MKKLAILFSVLGLILSLSCCTPSSSSSAKQEQDSPEKTQEAPEAVIESTEVTSAEPGKEHSPEAPGDAFALYDELIDGGEYSLDETDSYNAQGNVIGSGKVIYVWNEHFPQSVSDELSELNQKVLECHLNNDYKTLMTYFDVPAISSEKEHQEACQWYYDGLAGRKTEEYLRLYAIIDSTGDFNSSFYNTDEDLVINYQALYEEMCVYLMKSVSEYDERLLIFWYGKTDKGWKLFSTYLNDFSYHRMRAPEIFDAVKDLSEKGYDFPASLFYDPLSNIFHPAPYINFNSLTDVDAFYSSLTDKVYDEFSFPLTLSINSGVTIYLLNLQFIEQGFMPIIGYTTNIEVSEENEQELRSQAKDIREEIIALFPGMSETFDFFLYRAYVEAPLDPAKQYAGFATLVDETSDNE